MLETVKKSIHDLPDIPFYKFYNNYVMQVQDYLIDVEVKLSLQTVAKNPLALARLIDNYARGLQE